MEHPQAAIPKAIPLPQQPPQDPELSLPQAPSFPPSEDDVLVAVRYRLAVDKSTMEGPDEPQPLAQQHCVQQNGFEHSVVAQAAATAAPGAVPPWFHGAIQTLRPKLRDEFRAMVQNEVQQQPHEVRGQVQEVRGQSLQRHIEIQRIQQDMRVAIPRLNRLCNQCSRHGVRSLLIVPFPDGRNPPADLTPLTSVSAINQLSQNQLEEYLTSYDVPLPAGTDLRRDALKRTTGVAPP
ncbi:hypothetical protein EDB86DRAFT_3086078 [Lactarius hatsudake]|nr:hypothetical protein EDB86DRAFT_3086078 [Lactarius hatsudake]